MKILKLFILDGDSYSVMMVQVDVVCWLRSKAQWQLNLWGGGSYGVDMVLDDDVAIPTITNGCEISRNNYNLWTSTT
jgi:hypothetical protein